MWFQFSKQKMLVTLMALAQAATFTIATDVNAAMGLPQLGDGSDISSSAERRLGDRIARELYKDPDYLDDPVLDDYVQGIWQPLLSAARERGDLTPELDERFAWKILMGRDRSVNAFALPGGYFGLYLGLLSMVGSRDELASVLGHELSHVTQRHISRLISKNNQQTPWVIGAMILGALVASKSSGDAGSTLMVGGQALSAQSQLNFSRDMEREADRVGLGVIHQAGFDAFGFVTMFDKLQQSTRLNDKGAYPYLRTHPLTTERIADLKARLPFQATVPQANSPTVLHAMMTARAKVLANAGPDALHAWLSRADESQPAARQAGTLYGVVMAASLLREYAWAKRHLQRLQSLVSSTDRAAVRLVNELSVEIALAAHDLPSQQVQALGQLVGLGSQASSVTRTQLMLQAQIALDLNQPVVLSQVTRQLYTRVASHSDDALAWQWLSRLHTAQGQSLQALRAEAESRVAQLDFEAALDRLKAAQTLVRASDPTRSRADHIDASIIDVRRRQIELIIKDQHAD